MIFRVLVLVPTRELGVQVYQVTKQLAQFTTIEVGLSVGGLELKVQVRKQSLSVGKFIVFKIYHFRKLYYVKTQILLLLLLVDCLITYKIPHHFHYQI